MNFKFLSTIANATVQKISKRWFSKKVDKDVAPVAKKQPPVYDGSVDLSDRGIYAVDPCDALKAYPQPRVVIIGAGMAGLSAAARLAQHGITDIMVLEAYERPGGRILSCWCGDIVAELGAHWWPCVSDSDPVKKMLTSEDFPRPAYPGTVHHRGLFSNVMYGKMAYPPTVRAYLAFREIEKEAFDIYLKGGSKQQGSMLEFLSSRIQREVRAFPEEQQCDAARVMFGLAHMFTARSANDVGLLCSDVVGCFMSIPGCELRVPLGLVGILAPLLRQIPEGRIRYCTPVNCIYWGASQRSGYRAIVVGADGEEFHCDYVINTMSIGVLCNNAASMFCPALPSSKMDAIRCYGFSPCNKIFLEYCYPFPTWQRANFNFTFTNELCGRNDWTKGITSIQVVPNSKKVLCVWITGPESILMETMCDKDVAENITDVLRSVLGCPHIPYPEKILRSQWYSDPFFRGSFSFEMCNSEGEAQLGLSCPIPSPSESVPPILLFAGEATVPGHLATVSGARLSGIREADRILQLTLQFKGPPVTADNIRLKRPTAVVC